MRGGDADLSLKYGQSLIDFTPKLTTVGDVFGIAARVWVNSIKTGFVIMISWDYDRAAFNLAIYPGVRRAGRDHRGGGGEKLIRDRAHGFRRRPAVDSHGTAPAIEQPPDGLGQHRGRFENKGRARHRP